jgi:tetratricopeptide (TPR) repeat protein
MNQGSATVRDWRSGLTIAVLMIGLVASAVGCSTRKSEAELASEALTKGLAAHQAGNLAEAAAHYRQVLVHDPNSKEAYYNLGLVDQTNGSLASAESNYSLALSIDPEYVPALYNLAIVKTAEGDLEAAIELYRDAIRVDPTYAAAHLNLGFALIETGEKKEGLKHLSKARRRARESYPRRPSGNSGRGRDRRNGNTDGSTDRVPELRQAGPEAGCLHSARGWKR